MAKLTSKLVHDFLKEHYGISICDYSLSAVKNNEYKKKTKMYYSSEEAQRKLLMLETQNGVMFHVTEPESTEGCEVRANVLEVELVTTEVANIIKAKLAKGESVEPLKFTRDWQMYLLEKNPVFAEDIIQKAIKEKELSELTMDCLDSSKSSYNDDCEILKREIKEYNSAIVQAQKFLEDKLANQAEK